MCTKFNLKIDESTELLLLSDTIKQSCDSGNLKITNLDRLIFTKNGELTI